MKMIELILIIALSFGGGFFTSKTLKNKKAIQTIEQQHKDLKKLYTLSEEMTAKIDSLQSLPAKVDTVVKVVTRVEKSVDTLILLNKDIFLNVDTIKKEVREVKDDIKIK